MKGIRIEDASFALCALSQSSRGPEGMQKEKSPILRRFRQSGNLRFRLCVKGFGLLLLAVTACLLICGCENKKPKVHRVGILSGLDIFISTFEGFKAGMKDLGYVEGIDIVYDLQMTNFDLPAQERILRKFVQDKVDLMIVFPTEAAIAAKEVTRGTRIPVVFCQTNIEGADVVDSVTEPGGNMTGVRYPGPDLALKRFEILHELAPNAKSFWVPYARNAQVVVAQLAALRKLAAQAGVTLAEAPAEIASDLIDDLDARAKAADIGIDAVLLISEPLARTSAVFSVIAKFAAEHRIPVGGVLYTLGNYSTVFGVATKNLAVGRLTAQQAHKVLRGMPPGTMPVISAESFFQLNYRVARELGLQVPEGLLKHSDEVIR